MAGSMGRAGLIRMSGSVWGTWRSGWRMPNKCWAIWIRPIPKSTKGNAAAYLAELDALETHAESQLATIPDERRYLITNHDSLNYFARDYDLEILGTVIPGASTLAEPSAREMADLVSLMEAHGMCTIFTETSASDTLAQTVAAELDGCDEVLVVPLYTGSLGPPGSGADSYIGMYRANVDAIARGLAVLPH